MSTVNFTTVLPEFLLLIGQSADPRKYHASKFRKVVKKYFPHVTREEMDAVSKKAYTYGNDMYSILSVYESFFAKECSDNNEDL